MIRWLGLGLAGLGAALLGLNLAGVLRGPDVYAAPPEAAQQHAQFGRTQVIEAPDGLAPRSGESREAFLRRVTHSLHAHMVHYWARPAESSAARVPLLENFLLHVLGRLRPERYGSYEFHDPARGIERGFGLCSQDALILSGLLADAGIPADVLGLGGHVVAEAQLESGNRWLLDADYGVVIPFGLDAAQADPERVRSAYAAAGHPPARVDRIVEIYGPEGNRAYAARDGRQAFERRVYQLKWAGPALALGLGLGLVGWARRSPAARS